MNPSIEGVTHQLLAAGPGAVVRLSGDGRRLLSTTHLGQSVSDLDAGDSGNIAVAGDFGIAMLDPTAASVIWHEPLGPVSRVSVGASGRVAALDASGVIHVLEDNGGVASSFMVTDPVVSDLAMGPTGNEVFVVGANLDPSGECKGNVPFLRSYTLTGTLNWKAYDFSASLGNCASSQGVRVVVGKDGKLFYAGEQQGGNSAHLRNPQDASQKATLVSYDTYTAGFGMAILNYSFIARFEPRSGALEAGQVILPRDGQIGGSLRVGGLDADVHGNVYVAGQSSCCISGRDGLSISGTQVGAFNLPELSALVIAPDFASRKLWTTWTQTSSSEMSATAIAVGGGRVALIGNQASQFGHAIVVDPLEPNSLGHSDGFVSVWNAPSD